MSETEATAWEQGFAALTDAAIIDKASAAFCTEKCRHNCALLRELARRFERALEEHTSAAATDSDARALRELTSAPEAPRHMSVLDAERGTCLVSDLSADEWVSDSCSECGRIHVGETFCAVGWTEPVCVGERRSEYKHTGRLRDEVMVGVT